MQTFSLSGRWDIIERPLSDGPESVAVVTEAGASFQGEVPGDVNDSLVRAGRMPEPLVGTNFRQFGWVEDRSWWFRRRFEIPAEWADRGGVELSLDGLDVHADVWLNGEHLGCHVSAFLPFVRDVSARLRRDTENVLVVRLTTGREHAVPDPDFTLLEASPTEAVRGYPERGMPGRIYLRKPAYVWGWDWGPHLATCGITGRALLRLRGQTELREVGLRTRLDGADAVVSASLEMQHDTVTDTAWAQVGLDVTDEDGVTFAVVRNNVLVRSGLTIVPLELRIPDARLWWPNGSGPQHRYLVQAWADVNGRRVAAEPFRYGVRTVELEVVPGRFAFRINSEPVFIKGGNWIPPDALYGRVTDAKVTRLVEEAAEANFNCLRVWGGGRFEPDSFYEACDRLGILLWHDFMSACAPLPAHLAWFEDTFMSEADYQVRRLHNRACLMLWCGNNEVGGCYYWFKSKFDRQRDPAWRLYFERLPRLVHEVAPHVPYWPTSPYGGVGGVGDATVGDDHHWVVMKKDREFWSNPWYWDSAEIPIFNSEYGYGGPCCIESTREYLGTDAPDLFGDAGREHTNTFYDIPRVNFSIAEHYGDPSGLALEDFILRGGLCQGLNLGYSLESLRANRQTMGGLFWMYDDTWGENGWSIVDYYLRRKVAYYNVKRCLAPRRLVLRRGGQAFGGSPDEVLLIAVNDSDRVASASVQFGYAGFEGQPAPCESVAFSVAARSHTTVAACPVPEAQRLQCGTVMAIPEPDSCFDAAWWQHARIRDLKLPAASPRVVRQEARGADLWVTLDSASFAHAVHIVLTGDVRLSDHYIDLLPGQSRTLILYGRAARLGEAFTVRCVNAAP